MGGRKARRGKLFTSSPLRHRPTSTHPTYPTPPPGQELRIGAVHPESGVRGYLAVSGGVDVPRYLGSRATFPSGKFGGYQGRCGSGFERFQGCGVLSGDAGRALPLSPYTGAAVVRGRQGGWVGAGGAVAWACVLHLPQFGGYQGR